MPSESRIRVPASRELLPMRCRCCNAETVRLVIDLGDQPLCNRLVKPGAPAGSEPVYPLRLGYCESCTLMQIDHTIPRDDMFRDYVYVSGTTDTLRRHFAETTERLAETYSITPDDLVVDIGSNDGTWLRQWKERNPITAFGNYGELRRPQRMLGVEPATEIAMAAFDSGIPTINNYFDLDTATAIWRQNGPAKLITSAGSFFHMEDLHGACEGVKRLLADDGVFVVQAISGADMIFKNAFDQILHEHLCYYTPESFSALMELHGLELFDFRWLPIHGGTVEYHVAHAGKRSLQAAASKRGGPLPIAECEAFAHRVLKMRDELLAVLSLYRRNGKSVWAYGAPGKGATLLNSFGIGCDLVQCAVEKNPLKFGLDIPGCRIPILAERTHHVPPYRPDAYLVLAWNFLDEFLVKERAYLEAGGEFIVPVPNVCVIGGFRKFVPVAAAQ
jgi:hypothetical protein